MCNNDPLSGICFHEKQSVVLSVSAVPTDSVEERTTLLQDAPTRGCGVLPAALMSLWTKIDVRLLKNGLDFATTSRVEPSHISRPLIGVETLHDSTQYSSNVLCAV